jgi:hypothetical protein
MFSRVYVNHNPCKIKIEKQKIILLVFAKTYLSTLGYLRVWFRNLIRRKGEERGNRRESDNLWTFTCFNKKYGKK